VTNTSTGTTERYHVGQNIIITAGSVIRSLEVKPPGTITSKYNIALPATVWSTGTICKWLLLRMLG
jgi:hypothetical protein